MKKLLFLLVVLGLTLAGVAYWINKSWGHRPQTGEFTLAPVEFGSMSESVSATGVLQPQQTIVVGSSLPGRVVQVAADYNQKIREGELLARLDGRMAEQDLRDAAVAVRMAQAGVKRCPGQPQGGRAFPAKAARAARGSGPEARPRSGAKDVRGSRRRRRCGGGAGCQGRGGSAARGAGVKADVYSDALRALCGR